MHALNLHSLFETDSENNTQLLDRAITEFEELVAKTTDQQRLDNVISLCDALYDKSETESLDAANEALNRIVELIRPLISDHSDARTLRNAKLNLLLAQALQDLGDRTADDRALLESETAYSHAIAGFTINDDPGGRLADAKSGLAAVLQVRGQAAEDKEMLRRAVALYRELLETSSGAELSKENAGPIENLADALRALAALADQEEAGLLYSDAEGLLERAIRIYERQDENEQADLARKALRDVENARAAKEKSDS
jgi:tetratricopeptide (TPR) repeat protein